MSGRLNCLAKWNSHARMLQVRMTKQPVVRGFFEESCGVQVNLTESARMLHVNSPQAGRSEHPMSMNRKPRWHQSRNLALAFGGLLNPVDALSFH